MSGSAAPLGVFDSGVGGLSVVHAIMTELPNERLVYIADNANCPYGPRPPEEIFELSLGISHCLIQRGAKAIVVACNTASAAALSTLRNELDVPFIGMVPAVKPAILSTHSGVVGVLATPGTLHGRLYEEVVSQYGADVQVLANPCPGLVELIEAGELAGARTEALLRRCIDPLVEAGADRLVLGCTHYPFVIPTIERLYGGRLEVIEPSQAIARQVRRVLSEREFLATSPHSRPTSIMPLATLLPGARPANLYGHLGYGRERRGATANWSM